MFVSTSIVGTGFLTLPYALMNAGIVAGLIGLVLTSVLAATASTAILEVLARYVPATALAEAKEGTELNAIEHIKGHDNDIEVQHERDGTEHFAWLVKHERVELLDAIK